MQAKDRFCPTDAEIVARSLLRDRFKLMKKNRSDLSSCC